jgi:ubiquinone/menaquinone biosynthesis C-methylase UbiE
MNASDLTKTFVDDGGGYPDNPTGPRIDKVRQIFAGFPGRLKVLDVGCANGGILRPLAQQHELHGVDVSEGLVKLANDYGVKAVLHDFAKGPLPYPDKTFDAVFFGETIEHLVDTDQMMFELNRVLKPGGKLVLTFPNIRTLLSLAMMAFFDLPPMYSARYHSFHFRDFTLKTIKIVLRNHGFRYEKAVGSAFFLPKIGEFFSGLATFFPSWAHTVVVVGTKEKDSTSKNDELGKRYY